MAASKRIISHHPQSLQCATPYLHYFKVANNQQQQMQLQLLQPLILNADGATLGELPVATCSQINCMPHVM